MSNLPPSTPAKNTCNSSTRFAATDRPLNETCDKMDSEMRKYFVGPMPIGKFFDDFLPVQLPAETRDRLPSFEGMAGSSSESQMYDIFVRPPPPQSRPMSLIIPCPVSGCELGLFHNQSIRHIQEPIQRRGRKIQTGHNFLRRGHMRRLQERSHLFPEDGNVRRVQTRQYF